MKIFSVSLLIFCVCFGLRATQGLAIHSPYSSSEYYQPGLLKCKRYPDFSNATLPLSPPQCPFFPLPNTSPISTEPSTSLAKQSRVSIEIQPCEPHLQDIDACIGDILAVVLTNKLIVGPACCKAITEIRKDCFNGLIPPFISQFFGHFIKELCSVPRHASSILS